MTNYYHTREVKVVEQEGLGIKVEITEVTVNDETDQPVSERIVATFEYVSCDEMYQVVHTNARNLEHRNDIT